MSAHGRYPRSSFGAPVSRRGALKTFAGAAGFAALVPLLEACSSSSTSSSGGGGSSTGGGGTVTFGSNYSDASPKAAFAGMIAAAQAATGLKVTINTVDHNTFQNNISSYLQGTPDDLFTWFAGYRMQFFAAQGLAHQLDDVWAKIGGSFSSSIQSACKGLDGHYYIVPIYNYPWVVFYRKSVFAAKGYTVPTTWDDFTALLKKAKNDGLIPLAFADKDGWPALGTFDILNMRINGYDFHMQLMKHKVPWTDSRINAVFEHWQEIMPYMQTGANGRIWEDAEQTFEGKQAAMMFQGTDQVAAAFSASNISDLDFFPYPVINPTYGQDSIDAPIDGFMMASGPKNHDGAVKLLEYIGTAAAEKIYLSKDSSDVGVATGMDTSGYNAVQQKSVEIIKNTKNIAQFMDRDTDPGFADNVMIPAIQSFINNPSSYASTLKSVEAQTGQYFQTS